MQRARRLLAASFMALGAISASAFPALSQTGAEDEGTFEIVVNGRTVGTEQFSIRQTGVGASAEFLAVGRTQVVLASGSLDLNTRLRASGFQADPATYEVVVGGDAPRRVVGTVASGRFSARIVTPSGEQLREYLVSPGAIVLDDGVAHHYFFLARRTRNGSVPVLIPRENREVMTQVVDQGEEPVTIGSTAVTLYKLLVRPEGGEDRNVWVDALGRVIRVESPDRNYVATRTEIPR